jgi:hypothetical protein
LACSSPNQLFSRARVYHSGMRTRAPPFIQFLRTVITLSSCQPELYYILIMLVLLCFPHWKSSYCVAPFWKRIAGRGSDAGFPELQAALFSGPRGNYRYCQPHKLSFCPKHALSHTNRLSKIFASTQKPRIFYCSRDVLNFIEINR